MPTVVARRARDSPALDPRVVRRRCDRMLHHLDLADAELSVVLSDDAFVSELNRKHRRNARPTDVLAFPMDDSPEADRPAGSLLGDVVVSLDTAARQAQKRRRLLVEEVTHLVAHGLLHLIGYDHRTKAEERRMDSLTRDLVEAAGRRAPL